MVPCVAAFGFPVSGESKNLNVSNPHRFPTDSFINRLSAKIAGRALVQILNCRFQPTQVIPFAFHGVQPTHNSGSSKARTGDIFITGDRDRFRLSADTGLTFCGLKQRAGFQVRHQDAGESGNDAEKGSVVCGFKVFLHLERQPER